MLTIIEAKARARILKGFLTEHGLDLSHGVALEAVARLERHKTWANFLAIANDAEKLAPKPADVAAWPVQVFYFEEDEGSGYDAVLRMLPPGARLDDPGRISRWGAVRTEDGIEVPEHFELGEGTVATEVFARVPRVDRYGIPWFANEDMAPRFFREELMCAALDHVVVSLNESGDDTPAAYWFEAKVHPDIARQLVEAFESAKASAPE